MNNQATFEKMREMRFQGMLRAFRESCDSGTQERFTPDEMVAHCVDAEWDDRYNRKYARLLKNANFRYQARIEDVDFRDSRNIDKNRLLRFSNSDWIKKGESIIVTGATGVGKSFIACALGHQACIHRKKVLYYNSMKLFSLLKYAKGDGTYFKEMKKIQKQDLLILDDFGIKVLDAEMRLMMLEILEDRHGLKSIIITSQFPVDKWHEIIDDPTIADAICDRVAHSSHKIELRGESMRKMKARE